MQIKDPFKVASVEPCDAPRRAESGKWCRYVLANGSSRVVGRYCGSLTQVRSVAQRFADGLNNRARTGKVPWAPRSRGRKN
jgi:hypothetical protein